MESRRVAATPAYCNPTQLDEGEMVTDSQLRNPNPGRFLEEDRIEELNPPTRREDSVQTTSRLWLRIRRIPVWQQSRCPDDRNLC
jgi:hypothetical protein